MKKILFVCLGNICRSPMAEFIMKDLSNIRNMTRIAGGDPEKKIYKMMEFTGSGRDVADPWYTGDLEATYRDVSEGCQALLEKLKGNLAR